MGAKRLILRFLLLATALLSPLPAYAIDSERGLDSRILRFLSVSEGLPQAAMVTALGFGARGEAWVGTSMGPYRYDGKFFRHFPFPADAGGPGVAGFAVDGQQRLFALSFDGALFEFAFDRWIQRAPAQRWYHDIAIDADGRLILAGPNTVYRLEDERLVPHPAYAAFVPDVPLALRRHGDSTVVLRADSQGQTQLAAWDAAGQAVAMEWPDDLPLTELCDVVFGPEGARLFVFNENMHYYPANAPSVRLALHGRFECRTLGRRRLIDRDGVLWLGVLWHAQSPQLVRVTHEGRIEQRPEGFPASGEVRALAEAPDGALWAGLYQGGVAVLRDGPVRQRWLNYPDPGRGAAHGLTVAPGGNVWVAAGYGISEHDAHGRTLRRVTTEDIRSIAVALDGQGRVWAQVDGVLQQLIDDRLIRSPLQPREPYVDFSLVPDPDGSLWVLGERYLERIAEDRIELIATLPKPPRAVIQASDGTRWLLADAVYRMESQESGFTLHAVLRPDDPATTLRNITQFDGGLWIATNGEGLWRLPLDGNPAQLRRWGRNEGLPSDEYHGLAFGWPQDQPDKPVLWLFPATLNAFDPLPLIAVPYAALQSPIAATNVPSPPLAGERARVRGASGVEAGNVPLTPALSPIHGGEGVDRFTSEAPNLTHHWQAYNRGQGVIGAPLVTFGFPVSLTRPDGKIWLAGAEGLAIIDTAKRLPDTIPAPVLLAARIGTQWQIPQHSLTLPDAQTPFTLELISPRFDLAERWAARWRLDEEPWQELSSELSIVLGSLSPGQRRLQVQGVIDGRLYSEPVALALHVPRPVWQQPWALMLAALALLAASSALWRLRLRHLRHTNQRLSLEVQQRTEQAQQEIAARERAESRLMLGAQEEWLALNGPARVVAAAICQAPREPLGIDDLYHTLHDFLAPMRDGHDLLRRSLHALAQRGLIQADAEGWRLKRLHLRELPNTRTPLADLWRSAYTHIAQYLVLEPLGEGGMGAVFRAIDQDRGIEVALKRIKLDHTDEDEVHARFLNECEVLRGLEHPNIVRFLDAGRFHHEVYLAMELLPGRTLAQRLRDDGPLPEDQVLAILRDLRTALNALHSAGVVHRDLKPANLMQAESGAVKLIDFGLALDLSRNTRLTQSLLGVGTLDYCAPEQLFGAHLAQQHAESNASNGVGPHTDWWALGVTICELLTGHPPWLPHLGHREHLAALSSAAGPPRSETFHTLPPHWREFIDNCLITDPTRRRPAWEVIDKRLAPSLPI